MLGPSRESVSDVYSLTMPSLAENSSNFTEDNKQQQPQQQDTGLDNILWNTSDPSPPPTSSSHLPFDGNKVYPPGFFGPSRNNDDNHHHHNNNNNNNNDVLFDDNFAGITWSQPDQNMVVVPILIALIIILCLILAIVTIPPLWNMIQRKIPISQARIDRRYATIDGWLVTKRIQPHDPTCDCMQKCYGTKGGRQSAAKKTIQADGRHIDSDSIRICGTPLPAVVAAQTDISQVEAGEDRTMDITTDLMDSHPTSVATTPTCSTTSSSTPSKQTTCSSRTRRRHKKRNKRTVLTAAMLLEKLASAVDHSEDDEDDDEVATGDIVATFTTSKDSMDSSMDPSDEQDTVDIELLLLPTTTTTTTSAMTSSEEEEDEVDSIDSPGCSICLEAFRVKDKVSWSTHHDCGHVFHHSCIREWLLRQAACPCCRQILLPVDRTLSSASASASASASTDNNDATLATTAAATNHRRGRISDKFLFDYTKERAHRAATTYYCIEEGLITLHGFGLDRTSTAAAAAAAGSGSSSPVHKEHATPDSDPASSSSTSRPATTAIIRQRRSMSVWMPTRAWRRSQERMRRADTSSTSETDVSLVVDPIATSSSSSSSVNGRAANVAGGEGNNETFLQYDESSANSRTVGENSDDVVDLELGDSTSGPVSSLQRQENDTALSSSSSSSTIGLAFARDDMKKSTNDPERQVDMDGNGGESLDLRPTLSTEELVSELSTILAA